MLLVRRSLFIVSVVLLASLKVGQKAISGFDNFVFLALPHFTRMPSDQTAWEGEAVSFPCEAEGSPKPLIFWTMEGSQVHLVTHF